MDSLLGRQLIRVGLKQTQDPLGRFTDDSPGLRPIATLKKGTIRPTDLRQANRMWVTEVGWQQADELINVETGRWLQTKMEDGGLIIGVATGDLLGWMEKEREPLDMSSGL